MSGDGADLIERAADLLETDGWCRHFLTDAEGRHCVVGALRAVNWPVRDYNGYHHPKLPDEEFAQVWRQLANFLGFSAYELSVWNDAPERTAEGVIKALRSFAAKRREVAEDGHRTTT